MRLSIMQTRFITFCVTRKFFIWSYFILFFLPEVAKTSSNGIGNRQNNEYGFEYYFAKRVYRQEYTKNNEKIEEKHEYSEEMAEIMANEKNRYNPKKSEDEGGNADKRERRKFGSSNGLTEYTTTADDLLPGCTFQKDAKQFRTIDGTFNNLRNPNQGASEIPFVQTFPPVFDDGIVVQRGSDPDRLYNGFALPLGRDVSLEFGSDFFENDTKLTDMHVHFSQFIFADIISSQFLLCNDTVSTQISPVCGTGTIEGGPRENPNFATGYIDASQIYGSSVDTAIRIRDPLNFALLKRGSTDYATSTGKPLLPLQTDADSDLSVCLSLVLSPEPMPCFISGSSFFNNSPELLIVFTLFSREHNRLAKRLWDINPAWKAEKVYQEARKILGAILQHIFYKEYLPAIFTDLDQTLGAYRGYDPKVDASISDELTISTRWHHMIRPIIERLDADFRPIEGLDNIPLRDTFFAPRLILENGLDTFIRADLTFPARRPSPLTVTLDEFLDFPFTDLLTFDINGGRTRGFENYNTWRSYCGLPSCDGKGFDCYRNEIREATVRDKLEKLYGTTKNVEIGIGGLSEDPIDGEILGPTFKCLFIEQIRKTRDGDSFWYERKGVFPDDQLREIKKISLARIICDNSDAITKVPTNVFKISDPATFSSCDTIGEINLDKWKVIDTCKL